MLNLDDISTYSEIDAQDMREKIRELPQQCADAWAQVSDVDLPDAYRSARSVVVVGMGGSAIGGALVGALVAQEAAVPILSVGGYGLPAYVGADTLVIASSYSGNTEETLTLTRQAMEQGAHVLPVTTGGELGALAKQNGWPTITFAYPSQPRAALGYSFTLLLGALCHAGLLRDYEGDLDEAVAVMRDRQRELVPEVGTDDNPAKRLAWHLVERMPVIYGAGFLAPVARRWKGQFNENAKNWAMWETLPELNHNSVVGYGRPDGIRDRIVVICLRSSLDHQRIEARWAATQDLLDGEDIRVETVWAQGESRLAQMLSLIHFGDYVSYYLSLLNRVDPTPVGPIDRLKERLAELE
ncbi:MAG: bifunctional phosphoglucose/phosphomannose isomerase [Anaerolineae bacterium]|jgi:glucose/mannose-6-phosphate isomerase